MNPLLTSSWRKTLSISNPKNDFGDAKVISLFADNANLQKISLETVHLKEKITARAHFVKNRTKAINAIKMLFLTRGTELPFNDLTTLKAGKLLSEHEDLVVKHYGTTLRDFTKAINELEREIEKSLPEKAKRLMGKNGGLKGIADLTAAIIYTETKGKVTSSEALASYSGIAPVDKSSGKSIKHRNNKSGNRKLNCVFYRLSIH